MFLTHSLFYSSFWRAWADTSMERNTLMATVYPKLKEYCREKHGLEFQVGKLVPSESYPIIECVLQARVIIT